MTEKKEGVKISFFVPCYNEAQNVTIALEIIRTSAEVRNLTYEILVVDDGSTDSTSEVVQQYAKQHPAVPIKLFRNEVNRGLGANYLRMVSESSGEYYMIVFGDHCVPIDNLLEKIGEADIVVAYLQNPEVRSYTRRLISFVFTTLVNLISGNHLRYYNGAVIHKRENLLRCDGIGSGFGFQAEILCQLLAEGCTYVEASYRADQRKKDGTAAFKLTNILSVAASLYRIAKIRFFKLLPQAFFHETKQQITRFKK